MPMMVVSAANGRIIELRIRTSQPGEGSVRCNARAQPRRFLSTHAAINTFNVQRHPRAAVTAA